MTQQLGLFDAMPLSVRESRRARRLILRLLPPHTLELVVPRGTRPAEVAEFVAAQRGWIERARGEMAARYSPEQSRLPASIELKALGRIWPVRYRHDSTARPRCRAIDGVLELTARDTEQRGAHKLLHAWLIEQARGVLPALLRREALRVGRQPRAVQIRLQRTRWGSCSATGNISLNAGLLFVEPALVRYLLIHELCHLFSLGHSRRFWQAVERFEPAYRALDRELAAAWARIPLWVYRQA